jgi:hypothetical protein
MKISKYLFALVAISGSLFVAGCTGGTADRPVKGGTTQKDTPSLTASTAEDAKIEANLGKLSAEDRKVAEAQKWCAVLNENQLGGMGVPFKVMIKDQPVFLCCKGCVDNARADPDKTLAKVTELKSKAGRGAK